ncbi:MAG: PAS domain S-box protein [Alphaproteobacteria bacterium]|nr:PAS domain S-box protein [Alphaproteobacteria bacterium]
MNTDDGLRAPWSVELDQERLRRFFTSADAFVCYEAPTPIPISLPPTDIAERLLHEAPVIECNDAYAAAAGMAPPGELEGKTLSEILPWELPRLRTVLLDMAASNWQMTDHKATMTSADGRVTHRRVYAYGEIRDGALLRLWGCWQDITSEVEATEAARAAQSQLTAAFQHAPVGMAIASSSTNRYIRVNAALCAFLKMSEAELMAVEDAVAFSYSITHPDDIAIEVERFDALLSGRVSRIDYEKRFILRDGERRTGRMSASLTRSPDGTPDMAFLQIMDITEYKEVEAKYEREQALRRMAFDNGPLGISLFDVVESRWAEVNDRFAEFVGSTREELLAVPSAEAFLRNIIHPEDQEREKETLPKQFGGKLDGYQSEKRYIIPGVGIRWGRVHTSLIREFGQKARYIVTHVADITEEVRAAERHRSQAEQFAMAEDMVDFGTWTMNPETNEAVLTPGAIRLYGLDPDINPAPLSAITPYIHADDLAMCWATLERAFEGDPLVFFTFRYTKPGQDTRWLHVKMRTTFGEDGRPVRAVGVTVDITAYKRQEAEHQELSRKLRQRQHMETLGTLAGGVAHDFNSILASIQGSVELLGMRVPLDDVAMRQLSRVLTAVRRGSELADRLLTFARQKEGSPQPIDLNEHVRETVSLLERVIPAGIEVSTSLGVGLPPVLFDPGQFNQVLMNLLINARDAMPTGGRIVVETRYVAPDHVELRVQDSGVGMTEEVRARIFEPFYTTKGPERGSGLGLSTVFAIVEQSGGEIRVDSAPGEGSMFTVRLPASRLKAVPDASASGEEPLLVLLVEDDTDLREVLCDALDASGMAVRAFGTPSDLMAATDKTSRRPDLLITDVVLPGQNGVELSRGLKARFPGLRTIYMSGYTRSALVEAWKLDPDAPFIRKPFGVRDLLRAIREVRLTKVAS